MNGWVSVQGLNLLQNLGLAGGPEKSTIKRQNAKMVRFIMPLAAHLQKSEILGKNNLILTKKSKIWTKPVKF